MWSDVKMISEHQEAIQECLRNLNSLNILNWTYEQKKHIVKAVSELEAILEE